jgi:predicted signal transduction protein with EAL and GGDEF domain
MCAIRPPTAPSRQQSRTQSSWQSVLRDVLVADDFAKPALTERRGELDRLLGQKVLSHNLGLRVVAEGVEDETAMRTLGELDCDIAQGYYLSRPVPADDLLGILTASARRLEPSSGSARAAAR